MPLQKQLIDVPLSLGLDQRTDIRSLQTQGAVQMINCVRLETGSIRKRFGHAALSKSNSVFNPINVGRGAYGFEFNGVSYLSTRSLILEYSDEQAKWASSRIAPAFGVLDRINIAAVMPHIIEYDVCVATNQLTMALFTTAVDTTQSSFYVILDTSASSDPNAQGPGQSVVVPVSLGPVSAVASITGLKLIVCGTKAVATWQQNGSLDIKCSTLDMSTAGPGTWTAAVTLVTPPAGTVGVYDICAIVGDATRFVLLYELAAVNTVRLDTYTLATLVSSRTVDFDSKANFSTCSSMSVFATNNGHYWFAYTATTGAGVVGVAGVTRSSFYNETGPVSAAPITLRSWATGLTLGPVGATVQEAGQAGGSFAYFIQSTGYANGTAAMNTAITALMNAVDVAGVATLNLNMSMFNMQVASRPWVSTVSEDSSSSLAVQIHFGAYAPSLLQGTLFAVSYNPTTNSFKNIGPTGTFAPRLSKFWPQPMAAGGSFTLTHVAQLTSMPGGAVTGIPFAYATQAFRNSLALSVVDQLSNRMLSGAQLGNSRSMASALPLLWDGQVSSESGTLVYPELATPVAAGSGGSMSAGSYQYIVYYEARDFNGQVHRGATSVAVTVTTVLNDSVTVTIPTPCLSRRSLFEISLGRYISVTYAALYRTTANGTLFYRVTPDPPSKAWVVFDSLNGALANTITFLDTMSDATLTASATAQLLYTTGGVLDNFTPPAARCSIVHVNRFWLAGCDDPTQVWLSKALTSGESPGFNEAMNFNATGAVRAMASLDDKLILFVQRGTQYGIEYVTGQGPTDIGTQSDFTPPQRIPTDVGAIDQRGTVVGPFGVLFRSPVGGPTGSGGIHLLSRDLSTSYVGGNVQDTLNANPVVTSMVLHPNAGRVYITCVPTDVGFTSGVRLVWDYGQGGTWSVDQMFDADTSQTSAGARAAWVANTAAQGNAYHWVTAAGRVYRETNGVGASSYMDGAHYVQMTYQSAWLKPQIGGFARFWGLSLRGDSFEAHDFSMTLTYDYAPSSYYNETHTWTKAQIATFDRFPLVTVSMIPGNQKAEAIQFTLVDATPTGGGATTGQGPNWAAVVLELGVKEGAYRNLPPGQRA